MTFSEEREDSREAKQEETKVTCRKERTGLNFQASLSNRIVSADRYLKS